LENKLFSRCIDLVSFNSSVINYLFLSLFIPGQQKAKLVTFGADNVSVKPILGRVSDSIALGSCKSEPCWVEEAVPVWNEGQRPKQSKTTTVRMIWTSTPRGHGKPGSAPRASPKATLRRVEQRRSSKQYR
jgi:hypothetical protein